MKSLLLVNPAPGAMTEIDHGQDLCLVMVSCRKEHQRKDKRIEILKRLEKRCREAPKRFQILAQGLGVWSFLFFFFFWIHMVLLCYRAGRTWIHWPKIMLDTLPRQDTKKGRKKSSISLITESKMHIKGKIDQRQPIRIKNWFFDYGYKKEEKFLVEKSLSCCIGLLFDPVYEPETDSSFCHHHERWADSSTLTKTCHFLFLC